jgi:hypothetical protein
MPSVPNPVAARPSVERQSDQPADKGIGARNNDAGNDSPTSNNSGAY